jgi:hypothetical protein
MADSTLANYFSVDPSSTIWGAGQNALVAALPAFQTPGQGYSQNFASAMGASLLSALLGYQATRSANQQSLEAAGLGSQMLKLQTPDERLGFIKNVDSSNIQEKLLGLNSKLAEQELASKLAQQQRISELTTEAQFQMSPLAQSLAKAKQEQAVAGEIAKTQALRTYENSPEGLAAREFELRKIREEATARRTPLEDWLAREEAKRVTGKELEGQRQENRIALQDKKAETTARLQDLKIQADAGNKEADREFRATQAGLTREHETNLSQLKIELGAEKQFEYKQKTIDLEKQLIADKTDPKLARAMALAEVNKQMKEDLLIKQDELITKRNEKSRQLIDNSTRLRMQLERENPKISAGVTAETSEAIAIANQVHELASRIQNKIDSFPELKLAKSFTSAGDGLREEFKDIGDMILRVRTGAAAPLMEQENLLSIIQGTGETGPEQAVNLLREFSKRAYNVSANRLAAASQNPLTLIEKLRTAADTNMPVELNVNSFPGVAGPDKLVALQKQLAELKAVRESLQAKQGK